MGAEGDEHPGWPLTNVHRLADIERCALLCVPVGFGAIEAMGMQIPMQAFLALAAVAIVLGAVLNRIVSVRRRRLAVAATYLLAAVALIGFVFTSSATSTFGVAMVVFVVVVFVYMYRNTRQCSSCGRIVWPQQGGQYTRCPYCKEELDDR